MRNEPDRLIGEAPAFLQTLEAVSAVAGLEKPVLIVGERGTGKELFASRLHYLSNRWDAVYVQMNCAAISDSILESELFGHEAGAFTGATRAHLGRFERANGGTLFLDELATTSALVQEKILRVIEYGQFERLGGNKTISIDVRLVAATNEDLPTLAEEGRFRRDLLDRLAFDVITLPPLREREQDILLLADYFAVNMAKELGREFFQGFAEQAVERLMAHAWPGNVRELKNVVERAVYRSDPERAVEDIVIDPFESPYRPGLERRSQNAASPKSGASASHDLPLDLKDSVKTLEIELMNKAMASAKFNQRKAAELLGLTYHQFRGYLKKHDLQQNAQASDDGADAAGTE